MAGSRTLEEIMSSTWGTVLGGRKQWVVGSTVQWEASSQCQHSASTAASTAMRSDVRCRQPVESISDSQSLRKDEGVQDGSDRFTIESLRW